MTAKLGVLGGMGPLCTAKFYKMIVQKTKAAMDQDHIPMVILSDNLMPDRTEAVLNGTCENLLKDKILEDLEGFKHFDIKHIAIPCNTMHYYYDFIAKNTDINVINMVCETIRLCKKMGYKKIAVLGTYATMNCGLYDRYASDAGIEIVTLDNDSKTLIMDTIYRIKQTANTKADQLLDLVENLYNSGVDAMVLACTELSLVDGIKDYSYTIDAMEVLANACILQMGYALKEDK